MTRVKEFRKGIGHIPAQYLPRYRVSQTNHQHD